MYGLDSGGKSIVVSEKDGGFHHLENYCQKEGNAYKGENDFVIIELAWGLKSQQQKRNIDLVKPA